MEKFTFTPGVFFLIILAVIVISYIAGAWVQKQKDKPVHLPGEYQNQPGHSKRFPHHTHPHDLI